MKYCTAIVLIGRLNNFKADLKEIDIEKAINHPDNILRNIMLLAHLDKIDASTKK